MTRSSYVVVTAARNEAAVIGHALQAVTAQTVLPVRWMIIDDGSTDGTPEIVADYAARHPWIELIRQLPRADRSFAGKATAVNAGVARLRPLGAGIVVNLDADVSFPADYMAFLIDRFAEDPQLGVAGTPFTEPGGYDSARDSFEGPEYVAGPCQAFRSACFDEIGGYVANKAGGVDWIAVLTARMRGWRVRAFDDMRFHHHRKMGTAERSQVAALFSYGEKDYYLGGSPVWQAFRVLYRAAKTPRVIGGLALGAGYASAALRRVRRQVSPDLTRFHRADQMQKLRAIALSTASRALATGSRAGGPGTADVMAGQFKRDVRRALLGFVSWLETYGETSWDHQSYFAGPVGRRAKALYYRRPRLGMLAAAPMIASEASFPAARRLFHRRLRFPIADAHYAMGFGFLHEATGERRFLERMNHFLEKLEESRCRGYTDRAWGYPFDWVTRNGTIAGQTPLITTPYVYEALIKTLGVFTCLHYPLPVHLQHCYRDWGYAVGSLPVTEAVASSILSLPMFPGLTPEQQSRVAAGIESFLGVASA